MSSIIITLQPVPLLLYITGQSSYKHNVRSYDILPLETTVALDGTNNGQLSAPNSKPKQLRFHKKGIVMEQCSDVAIKNDDWE